MEKQRKKRGVLRKDGKKACRMKGRKTCRMAGRKEETSRHACMK
jgi:hypothetical protein